MIRRLIILLLIVGCIPTTPTLQSTFEINDSGGNAPTPVNRLVAQGWKCPYGLPINKKALQMQGYKFEAHP